MLWENVSGVGDTIIFHYSYDKYFFSLLTFAVSSEGTEGHGVGMKTDKLLLYDAQELKGHI